MTEERSLKKNHNPAATENQVPSFDSVCTCDGCDHEFARDCLKVRCTCCNEYNHSMVLDGIEGFSQTDNQNA